MNIQLISRIFPVQIVWWELMLASRLFVHAKPKLVSILLCSTCDGFSVVWLALAMQTLEALQNVGIRSFMHTDAYYTDHMTVS